MKKPVDYAEIGITKDNYDILLKHVKGEIRTQKILCIGAELLKQFPDIDLNDLVKVDIKFLRAILDSVVRCAVLEMYLIIKYPDLGWNRVKEISNILLKSKQLIFKDSIHRTIEYFGNPEEENIDCFKIVFRYFIINNYDHSESDIKSNIEFAVSHPKLSRFKIDFDMVTDLSNSKYDLFYMNKKYNEITNTTYRISDDVLLDNLKEFIDRAIDIHFDIVLISLTEYVKNIISMLEKMNAMDNRELSRKYLRLIKTMSASSIKRELDKITFYSNYSNSKSIYQECQTIVGKALDSEYTEDNKSLLKELMMED